MSRLWATCFGVGYLPYAPGTWGSAVAIPLAWLLHSLGGFPVFAVATVLVSLTGWWAIAAASKHGGDHDPSEFVIDEVAGQWVALWPLSAGLWAAGAEVWLFPWPGWVGAFVLFRLFDILKPGPVGWADRREDAAGVMLDDIIAGAMAAAVIAALAALYHGVMG